jgi:hypothetical protein
VIDLLARHGWRKLMPRPHHPQRDLAAQQDFKKMRLSTSCKAGSARGRKLWVLFADEARFGWMNRPRPAGRSNCRSRHETEQRDRNPTAKHISIRRAAPCDRN